MMTCKYCEFHEDNEILKETQTDEFDTFKDKWEVEILRYGTPETKQTALLTLQCETERDFCYTDFQIKYCPFCGEQLEN